MSSVNWPFCVDKYKTGEHERSKRKKKKSAYGQDIDEGGLAAVLQTDQSQLHFLLPEEAAEPVEQGLDK